MLSPYCFTGMEHLHSNIQKDGGALPASLHPFCGAHERANDYGLYHK